MYGEPPDPEPNPCPYCGEELGCNDGCDHCKLAAKLSVTEGALSTLKHRLHCRARNLAWLAGGAEVAARRAEGVALLLDLAGLPMPADYMAQARAAMTAEYGEHAPYRAGGPGKLGHNVPDAEIVARFMEWAHGEALASSPATFSGEILSAKPATHADQLWWGDDDNGVPRIFTQAEKRQGRGCGAGSTQWGLTLRETIEKALAEGEFEPGQWAVSACLAVEKNPSGALAIIQRLKRELAAARATSPAAAAPEPVAAKYLFIQMDDDNRAWHRWCADAAEVREAVKAAMFILPAGEELSAEHLDQLDDSVEELMDSGALIFEGDPPLYLYRMGLAAWEKTPAAHPAPAVAATVRGLTDAWRQLYRRAINEANGLTNYVEDRPELRRAERNISAIEAEARALATAAPKGQA